MNKCFSCTLAAEKILEYMSLTWPEDINKFNKLYLGKKEKRYEKN